MSRRDDGVGIELVRRLARSLGQEVFCMERNAGGLDLIEEWKGMKRVWVFDAVYSGAPAGTIYRYDGLKDPIPSYLFSVTTHSLGIAEVIALARGLKRLSLSLTLYGIEGKSFEKGEGLSPEVHDALQQVLGQASREILGVSLQPTLKKECNYE